MKIYYSGGNKEFTLESFVEHLINEGLLIREGIITEVKILERKSFSNKGNALDGNIQTKDGGSYGLNIGGNPIGTGYRNYTLFLKDMDCFKVGRLYIVKSLIGKEIVYLEKLSKFDGSDTLKGYIAPPTFFKDEELILEIKKQLNRDK